MPCLPEIAHIQHPLDSPEQAEEQGLRALPALLELGYGFSADAACLLAQFRAEYAKPGRQILVAHDNGLALATLAVQPLPDPIAGKRAVHIGGIVVQPAARRLGLASRLIEEAVRRLHAEILLGATNRPEAVWARAKACGRLGMRTFYGLWEVTPAGPHGQNRIHESILRQYREVREASGLDEQYLFPLPPGILSPAIPDTSQFPDFIGHAFAPVVERQRAEGGEMTVVTASISCAI